MRANQLRLWFSSLAYALVNGLRRVRVAPSRAFPFRELFAQVHASIQGAYPATAASPTGHSAVVMLSSYRQSTEADRQAAVAMAALASFPPEADEPATHKHAG